MILRNKTKTILSFKLNIDLLFETIPRIEIEQNLESIAYFCTTLKNLTVNNELICLISEKKPFELLKNILKHLLQVRIDYIFYDFVFSIFDMCLFLVERSNTTS